MIKRTKKEILKLARKEKVKFIKLWFTDILGFLKSFAITINELERALEDGMGFDGSSIEGFARIDESDMIARPDTNTFAILPWGTHDGVRVARMFCDVFTPEGRPFEGDPRYILKRNLEVLKTMGFAFYVGPELEYFYFQNSNNTEVLDKGGYFDLTPRDVASDLRKETVLALEKMGIDVEYSHHEVAPSQHEIDLRFTDALSMADNVMTYRLVVKEVALKNGVYATFMPKPMSDTNGSGMHTHQSFFRTTGAKKGRNAFFDKKDKYHLSKIAKYYIAGLLKHVSEITLVTNQWINSYKRLVPGFEAPVFISWARRNRSDLVRIPEYKKGNENATRMELRNPDPACNPYLAFSAMLAVGLEGIRKKYKLPEPVEENVYNMTAEERKRRKIDSLPPNLFTAIGLAEKSSLLRECMGEHLFNSLIKNKKIEWNSYRAQVTDYELKKYLPIL